MRQIYQSFIQEVSALGCVAEYRTDHVEFSSQGYKFHVVLEDEETGLLRISANVLSTNTKVREWIAVLFEGEGTMCTPTFVYDVKKEKDSFQLDVAISFLFLFSPETRDKALYLKEYVMGEIQKKVDMLYKGFQFSYDKNFDPAKIEKGDRDDLLQKDFIPTYYKEALNTGGLLKRTCPQTKSKADIQEDAREEVNSFIFIFCLVVIIIVIIGVSYYLLG